MLLANNDLGDQLVLHLKIQNVNPLIRSSLHCLSNLVRLLVFPVKYILLLKIKYINKIYCSETNGLVDCLTDLGYGLEWINSEFKMTLFFSNRLPHLSISGFFDTFQLNVFRPFGRRCVQLIRKLRLFLPHSANRPIGFVAIPSMRSSTMNYFSKLISVLNLPKGLLLAKG